MPQHQASIHHTCSWLTSIRIHNAQDHDRFQCPTSHVAFGTEAVDPEKCRIVGSQWIPIGCLPRKIYTSLFHGYVEFVNLYPSPIWSYLNGLFYLHGIWHVFKHLWEFCKKSHPLGLVKQSPSNIQRRKTPHWLLTHHQNHHTNELWIPKKYIHGQGPSHVKHPSLTSMDIHDPSIILWCSSGTSHQKHIHRERNFALAIRRVDPPVISRRHRIDPSSKIWRNPCNC